MLYMKLKSKNGVSMKKYIYPIMAAILSFLLVACGQGADQSADKKTLKVGLPPSAHNVLVEKVVVPQLEKQGYTVELMNFNGLRDANEALISGGIDFHTAQHQAYLNVYNRETKSDLASLVHTPSIPAFIYSIKQTNLDNVKDKDQVLIPNDPSNTARAYALLAKVGWIEVNPEVDIAILTQRDITNNPYNLAFKEVDSALIPRLLQEIDYGIMPGGVALLAGIGSEHALAHETFLPDLELLVTVKKADLETTWAKDVKKSFQSDEMKTFIETDPEIKGRFIWPEG